MRVLHSGEVTIALHESTPVLLEIKKTSPHDEYVHVLQREVTLIHIDGKRNNFKAGENLLVSRAFGSRGI